MLRALFMGSPRFALPSLEVVARRCELTAVYTQPDRPRGRRGKRMLPTPVKSRALELGIPVYTPARLKDQQVIDTIASFRPHVIVVVAYAKLIPPVILEIPTWGCINLHPSLLPRYRGASPIQAAIMNGDKVTGVTTFFMNEEYDKGDIILAREVKILPDETGTELSERLSVVGAKLLEETLQELERGNPPRIPQTEEGASLTHPIKKSECRIDWSMDREAIYNFVRALAYEPAAFSLYEGCRMKIGRVVITETDNRDGALPGEVVDIKKGVGPVVAVGNGTIALELIKPPGKSWMSGWAYHQGRPFIVGKSFE